MAAHSRMQTGEGEAMMWFCGCYRSRPSILNELHPAVLRLSFLGLVR